METEFELNNMLFRWRDDKAASNVLKHGVNFKRAAEAFFDLDFQIVDATRNEESRDALLGMDFSGNVLFVVHIEIEAEFVRIISARNATPLERRRYVNS